MLPNFTKKHTEWTQQFFVFCTNFCKSMDSLSEGRPADMGFCLKVVKN